MRFFNTAGPIKPDKHYAVPSLERLDLAEVLLLLDQEKYFVLHAPRQTGKTSALFALRDEINRRGSYHCLYVNLEPAQAARENVELAMRAIVYQLAQQARTQLGQTQLEPWARETLERGNPHGALLDVLARWAEAADKPLVLLLDEVDSLIGDTLISLLRQLRAGYPDRPRRFPQSIVLCGVRDVRDYRIHSATDKAIITGGSAFNIKAESLRLDGFSYQQLEALYAQHTAETGQPFEPQAVTYAWEMTQGQPWLVNALAYQAAFKDERGRDRSQPLTRKQLVQGCEALILRRDTHLDQLVDKLHEPRVRRIIEPILTGVDLQPKPDDLQYVLDLGLVEQRQGRVDIANPIYREVIPRELTQFAQLNLGERFEPAWFVREDGRLNSVKLLEAFQQFFRENAESWVERFDYKEAGPHLIVQAFLQRVVNGGGRIHREYALGRRRVDLLIEWPLDHAAGMVGPLQRVALELKLVHKSVQATIEVGLDQVCAYADASQADEAHLILFDRDEDKPWSDKIFTRNAAHGGRSVTIWGM